MVDVLIKLVIGRFVALLWHGIATILLIFGKTPLVQIEVDPRLAFDLRNEQFESIDTWWVSTTVRHTCYSSVISFLVVFWSMSRG